MAALKIILFTTWINVFCVQSATLKFGDTSYMEAGTFDTSSKLLYTFESSFDSNSGDEVDYRDVVISHEKLDITYLNATEMGKYPDARASIQKGGPGQSFVTIRLNPGLSKGFNYTVNLHVAKIPRNFEKCYHKYELTYYKRNDPEYNEINFENYHITLI